MPRLVGSVLPAMSRAPPAFVSQAGSFRQRPCHSMCPTTHYPLTSARISRKGTVTRNDDAQQNSSSAQLRPGCLLPMCSPRLNSVSTGLSEEEAGLRLELYGSNTISSRQKVSVLAILVHQFQSLVVALPRSGWDRILFQGMGGGGAIVGVSHYNTLIGFVTEIKAVRSIEALRALGTRSGQRESRQACAPHSGQAPLVPGLDRASRCRRCDFGGHAACGGVEPRRGKMHTYRQVDRGQQDCSPRWTPMRVFPIVSRCS